MRCSGKVIADNGQSESSTLLDCNSPHLYVYTMIESSLQINDLIQVIEWNLSKKSTMWFFNLSDFIVSWESNEYQSL